MRYVLLLSGLIYSAALGAQVPTEELEQELESIAEGNEENNLDLTQVAENLALLRQNPIAVNFATKEDLKQIPYLNIFQIANLLQYRQETGMIFSPFELRMIKGFNQNTITQILPYLNFDTQKERPELKPKNIWRYSNHNVLLRSTAGLQKRKGYEQETQNGYLGHQADYYLRYRGTYRDNISLGFTAQQDAGEPFGSPNDWIDQLSGHVALQNYGGFKNIILGDFQAEFGQGLALWSSLAFSKGAQSTEIKRYPRGFRPFTGAEENRFFRGVATTYRWESFTASTFYSNLATDANISALDSLSNPALVSSLQSTGLHRTANELADKDANRLQTMGGNLQWDWHRLNVGLTGVNYQLQLPLEKSQQLYQKFRFSGNSLSNYSFDFNYLYRDLNFYGEVALSDNGASAQTIGLQSHPADGFYATVQFRNFDRRYQALYNAPFAEAGQYGERGFYLGTQWQLNAVFQLRTYLDLYRFSWLRFGVDAPSRGRDWLVQLNIDLNRNLSGYLRVRSKARETTADNKNQIPGLVAQSRSSGRFHLVYQLRPNWRLASRIEISLFQKEAERKNGTVFFQDLRYTFPKVPFQLTGRVAFISTDDFDTRIYAYENDLTYTFSIPPYYGRATRFYLLADWDIADRFTLQAKYAITTFYDREEISSGLQTISGPQQSELRLQLRWRF